MGRQTLFLLILGLVVSVVSPEVTNAQGGGTGTIVGTVSDASGAVIPGAQVSVRSEALAIMRQTETNEAGQYTLPDLPIGDYSVTVSASGFRASVLRVRVAVARSALANMTLEVGSLAEIVEVTAGARQQLQTLDAAVGDSINTASDDIQRLPTTQRRATELVYLQVATTPVSGTGAGLGGSVAGSRPDQNTATLDGILINDLGNGGVSGGPISNFTVPLEALEEFRGIVSNPDESMGRSGGGHFSLTTKGGTNEFHGATYWYHQNDDLNANSWTRNRLGQPKAELKDNRFGARFGGPIIRQKTFFHLFYEGRRLPQQTEALRIGISESLRQGILRFQDASGNINSYDLRTSTQCGSTGNQACDPRGLGLSPVIKDYFSLYPVGNDTSVGDGLNTVGIRDTVDTPARSDAGVARLDHNLGAKWRLSGSFLDTREDVGNTVRVIMNPAPTSGAPLKSVSTTRNRARLYSAGLTGVFTPSLIGSFRVGFNRQDLIFDRGLPSPRAGAGLVLDIASTTLDDPDDTQVQRIRNNKHFVSIWQTNNTFSWARNRHVLNFGANYQHNRYNTSRVERTLNHIIPIARIRAGEFLTLPASQRPPICGGAGAAPQTNCLRSSDVGRWNDLYAAVTGMWDNTQGSHVRDAQGNPLGIVPIENTSVWHHLELHAGDKWSLHPSLTLSYGLNFGYETPLSEVDGRHSLIIDQATGELLSAEELLKQKKAAADQGRVLNPQIAYIPVGFKGDERYQDIYDPIVTVGPRAAVAWNPSFKNGVLGRLFGDRGTVLRGGYSLLYDSILGVNTNVVPLIGNQLIATSYSLLAPTCDSAGTGGPGCISGSSPFRVGVDGPAFGPSPGPLTIPFVPQSRDTTVSPGVPFGVLGGQFLSPDYGVGHIHGANFTFQREVSRSVAVELGWIGRWGRNLNQGININAPPVSLRDMSGLSNQTFAQAFDAVAAQLRSGVPAAAVTPQPWFDNVFGAGGTVAIASRSTTDIVNGRLDNLFINTIDPMLQRLGKPTVLNQQFNLIQFAAQADAFSNYHALFTSIRQRPVRGLSWTFNWTWSHCQDTGGRIDDSLSGSLTNPYDPAFDYGDCLHDRRHVVNSYGMYELPFSGSRLLSGWYISFLFGAWTGLPLSVSQGGAVFGAPVFGGGDESVPFATRPPEGGGSVHQNVSGSGGVATAGNPATGGSGVNLFANPEAVFRSLRPFRLSEDTRTNRGFFRGPGQWNFDLSVGKRTALTGTTSLSFSVDFFNILNRVNFATPSLSLQNPANFGVITSDRSASPSLGDINSGPRRLQASLRLEF